MPTRSTAWILMAASFLATAGCASGPGAVDPDAPKDFITTASGLKYRILRNTPSAKPKSTSRVKVNYKGWLDNGKVFDSSYDRGQAIDFRLTEVVPGWTEGLQYCPEGGMIELEIPSELGYGPGGTPGIPPNSTLHFIVELIEIITST